MSHLTDMKDHRESESVERPTRLSDGEEDAIIREAEVEVLTAKDIQRILDESEDEQPESIESDENESELEIEFEFLQTNELHSPSSDIVRENLSDLERIGTLFTERYPHIMSKENLDALLEVGHKVLHSLEQQEKSEIPDFSDMVKEIAIGEGITILSEVTINFPSIRIENQPPFVISEGRTLTELVRSDFPEILYRPDYYDLMNEAHNHFDLIEHLDTKTTTIEVENLAKKYGIDHEKAINWIIYNERPAIYSLIEEILDRQIKEVVGDVH